MVTVRSMHSPRDGWTEADALSLLEQGYSVESVAARTGYAAAWLHVQNRRRQRVLGPSAGEQPGTAFGHPKR